jgi:hypothetical protein
MSSSDPVTKLTAHQIEMIQAMFEWPFIYRINVDERVAKKAVELARDFGLKPADSVHAAAAILKKVSALQRWDRDFDKVKHLIPVEEPKQISDQQVIADFKRLGPAPEDFESAQKKLVSAESVPPKEENNETTVQPSGETTPDADKEDYKL